MIIIVEQIRRYSRSDLSEPPSHHPPFQHQMRMQIRHMISQQHKHHKRKHQHKKINKSEDCDQSSPKFQMNGFVPNVKLVAKSDYRKLFAYKFDAFNNNLCVHHSNA